MFFLRFGLVFAPLVLLALLIAIILHEVAHALVAKWNGDLTAKFAKRTSLNPYRHFNLLGFLMLIFVGFGFAKPVPVNVENFKNKRKGTVLVSIAGIITNILLALTSAFFLVIVERFGAFRSYGLYHLYPTVVFNIEALTTIPLAASAVFAVFFGVMLHINIVLALFNLLPFFPLDGHRLMEAGLGSFNKVVKFFRDWGMAILLGLVGLDFVFGMLGQFTNLSVLGVPLWQLSPLRLYMHYVGGAIINTFMNLFRVMFGVPVIWPF